MISLSGDGFSINIEEDNAAYKNLKRFDGETVTIHFVDMDEATTEESIEEKKPALKTKFIDRSNIWKKFYKEIPWDKENPTQNPIAYSLLKNHLEQVLNGESGKLEAEEVEPGIFKANDLFIVL